MKTLLLLRHAKSSWKTPDLADHDRPLSKRGKRDAPRMGEWIAEQELLPQVILTSTARRATATLQGVQLAWEEEIAAREFPELYHASPEQLAETLRHAGGDCSRLLLIGHNPGMQMFLRQLLGWDESFPTCALAWMELSVENWSDFTLETPAQLRSLWKPKELW